jgi:hypothetical protein
MANRTALTVADVAAELGVDVRLVLAWIGRGELAAVNVSRSPLSKRPTWRVLREKVNEFLAARQHTPTPTRSPRRRLRPDPHVIEFIK